MPNQVIRDTRIQISNDFYSIIWKEKKILNFIGPRSNDVFNVSHQKAQIFLTHLCFGLSHLKEHKFKHSILDTLILFVFAILISKHGITFFSAAQDLLTKDKTFSLKLKGLFLKFLEKPALVLHQYFFMAIRVFQLNLTPTYSIHLLTIYYPQKGLNLLSLQRLDS